MRNRHISSVRMTRFSYSGLIVLTFFATLLGLTCNGEGTTTPGPPEPYDPFRPTIESFSASRNDAPLDDDLVYGGEDIVLTVTATSHAFPQSCGLGENDVVEGNLTYTFVSNPPEDVPAPGLLSQATPPSNEALWRVPNLTDYDTGEGLVYILEVTVYDQCLGVESTGSLTLRALADQGPPNIQTVLVESSVNSTTPVTEELDKNGLYEVERSDKCRITITASNRTFPSVCANRGVADGEELVYQWDSSIAEINLTYNEFPSRAVAADFDVPMDVMPGQIFTVECLVRDMCSGTSTTVSCRFIAVHPPRITSLDGTQNGGPLLYDPFFDVNETIPGDEIILTATGMVLDPNLCDSKGIDPDLLWDWLEINESIPALAPSFDPTPIPNDSSTIEFVTPAALSGTVYRFQCTITDRCNGLTDSEATAFLVIVHPIAELSFVEQNSVVIEPEIATGRFHVFAGDTVRIRVWGSAASGTGFCEARGVSQSPPLEYWFSNPWDVLILNYDPLPSEEHCDLELVVPGYAPQVDADLTCRVTDLCNELVTELVIPFRVVE